MLNVLNASAKVKDILKPTQGNEEPIESNKRGEGEKIAGEPDIGGSGEAKSTTQGGTTDIDELFDELLTTPLYRPDQFVELLRRTKEERGTTLLEKRYWSHPRRWKVVLWGVKLQNCILDDKISNAFVEFDVGGDREEVRIALGTHKKVYTLGTMKIRLRTGIIYDLKGGEPAVDLEYRTCFEYRGSYLDLEQEKIKIRVWNYKKFFLNQLEGIGEEILDIYASGPMYRQHHLYKSVGGKRTLRCSVSFNLYFQEIYDFELKFFQWRVFGYQTTKELLYSLQLYRSSRNLQSSQSHSNVNQQNITNPEVALYSSINQKSSLPTSVPCPKPFITDDTLLHCKPRLIFRILSQTSYNNGLTLYSPVLLDDIRPQWDSLGSIYFRGTILELESAVLQIDVQDESGGSKSIVAKTEIPLRGIVDYAFLKADLRAPPWMLMRSKLNTMNIVEANLSFGSVEGKVSIANTPRHRQTGELGSIDKSRVNLFVQIDKIDTIVTEEDRTDVSPFVQVSFDGDSRTTRIVPLCMTPIIDEMLVFPIQIPDKNELTLADINQKGFIWIDVWAIGSAANEHCGGASFSLKDLFFDGKNIERPLVDVRVVDSETGDLMRYNTRKLEAKKPLGFNFITSHLSHIFFSAWTMPDLLRHCGATELSIPQSISLPLMLMTQMDEYKGIFEEVCLIEAKKLEPKSRFYYCTALDQRLKRQFLPTFCGKVVPPKSLDNCNSVAHYVRCVNFCAPKQASGSTETGTSQSTTTSGNKKLVGKQIDSTRIWATPEFTLTARCGSIADHALLHVSLLIGLSVQAFVCIGSLWSKVHHVWVCTFHFQEEKDDDAYGYIRFWETTNGVVFVMKNRFKDRQVIKDVFAKAQKNQTGYNESRRKSRNRRFFPGLHRRTKVESAEGDALDADFVLEEEMGDSEGKPWGPHPKLPYRSLDIMFNHLNIWVNKQDPNPTKMWFDIWRENLWHQFTPDNYDIKPCFTSRVFGRVGNEATCTMLKSEIKEYCIKNVAQFRASRNMTTRWNHDAELELFLEKGLTLLHQSETATDEALLLAGFKLKDWKEALYSKVPKSWRLRGLTVHFNRADPRVLGDAFVQKCDFLECRDRSATFAVAIHIKLLPGELTSVYVILIMLQRVTEREKRKIREQQEKERREKALKRLGRSRKHKKKGKSKQSTIDESQFQLNDDMENHFQLIQNNEQEEENNFKLQQLVTLTGENVPVRRSSHTSASSRESKINQKLNKSLSKQSTKLEKLQSKIINPLPSFKKIEQTPNELQTSESIVGSVVVPVEKKAIKIKIAPGSCKAALCLTNPPIPSPWNHPDQFRIIFNCVETSVAESLRIPTKRVKAYECFYMTGKISFLIGPPTSRSNEPALQLVQELAESIQDVIRNNPKLNSLTNGSAIVIWEDDEDNTKNADNNMSGIITNQPYQQLDSYNSQLSSQNQKKKPTEKRSGKITGKSPKKIKPGTGTKRKSVALAAEITALTIDIGKNSTTVSFAEEIANNDNKYESAQEKDNNNNNNNNNVLKTEAATAIGVASADSTREKSEPLDDAAQRKVFYAKMEAADPAVFQQLLIFYRSQGHSEDHAKYFAAYYTAMKLQQTASEAEEHLD